MALTASASFRSSVQPRFLRTCLIFHHIPFSFSMFRISSCCVCLIVSHGSSLPPQLIRSTFFLYFPFLPYYFPLSISQHILDKVFPGFCGSPSAVLLLYLACHTFFGFLPFPFSPFLLRALFPDLCAFPSLLFSPRPSLSICTRIYIRAIRVDIVFIP